MINVKDYGANGGGSTGDASANVAAFRAAIAAAYAGSVAVGEGGQPVIVPAGHYYLDDQIVQPGSVNVLGEGGRSTKLEWLPFGAIGNGAWRMGDGTYPVFQTQLRDTLLEMGNIAGSQAFFSSDLNDGSGCVNVCANNFDIGGFKIYSPAATAFNSVNDYVLRNVESYRGTITGGGANGWAYWIEGGTLPGELVGLSAVGQASAPLTAAIKVKDAPFIATALALDGYGMDGIDIDTGVPFATVTGIVSKCYTNAVNIHTPNPVSISSMYRIGGSHSVVDCGCNGFAARTVDDQLITTYARGPNISNFR